MGCVRPAAYVTRTRYGHKDPIMRYAFLAAIPVAATAWFFDHRAAALIGIVAILVSFIAVVFDLGRRPDRRV